MGYILISGLILIFLILIEITKNYILMSHSTYKNISGNNVLKVTFNTGIRGEFYTYRLLEKAGETHILSNVYLPKRNGETTEVDLLCINKKGIFVFESKNYSGWIFGNEKYKMWTQSLKDGKKYKFFNPIMQNKGHISAINNYLQNKYNDSFISYIIFSNRCELKKISVYTKNVYVINRYSLKKHLFITKQEMADRFSDALIQDIYNQLKIKTLVSDDVKQKHIQDIKNKH